MKRRTLSWGARGVLLALSLASATAFAQSTDVIIDVTFNSNDLSGTLTDPGGSGNSVSWSWSGGQATVATVTAAPVTGYTASFSSDSSSSPNCISKTSINGNVDKIGPLAQTASCLVHVTFAAGIQPPPPPAGFTITAVANGSGVVSPPSIVVQSGSTTLPQFTLTPGGGGSIVASETTDNCGSGGGQAGFLSGNLYIVFNPAQNCQVTVQFGKPPTLPMFPWYIVQALASPEIGGTVTPNNQQGWQPIGAEPGDAPQFIITPDPGWTIQSVNGGSCGGPPISGAITGGTLSATQNVYTPSYNLGVRNYFTLNPLSQSWACVVIVQFAQTTPYRVTVSGGDGGSISPVDSNDNDPTWYNPRGSVTVPPGGYAQFMVRANPGWSVTNIDFGGCGNGVKATIDGAPYYGYQVNGTLLTVGPIIQSCNINPTFTPQQRNIVGFVANFGGFSSVRMPGGAGGAGWISVPSGVQAQAVFVANPGYVLTGISNGCANGTGSFNPTSKVYTTGVISYSCTVNAQFTLGRPWATQGNVTPVVNGSLTAPGGTINPAVAASIDIGDTTSFVITPDIGYTVQSVTGCAGAFDSSNNIFTTGAIYGDCTVTATFIHQ